MRSLVRGSLFTLVVVVPLACGSSDSGGDAAKAPEGGGEVEFTGADVGPEGGVVEAPPGSPFAGVKLVIPAGALSSKIHVSFQGVIDETDLPETAERVGPHVKLLPEGTTLAVPAELTLPLDREMVSAYGETPAGCKVWARKDAGWEKLEQVGSTDDSVTVPIGAFTTAATGISHTINTNCLGKIECLPTAPMTFASLDQLCDPVDGEPFCLIPLPLPERTRSIDEFASLAVVGHKLYWVASTDDGVTVVRYDLDKPDQPLFKYPAYTGPSNGSIASRGNVTVQGTSAWVGIGGVGNVRFDEGASPTIFDSTGPRGVGSGGGQIIRFRSQNVVSNGNVSKTDIRAHLGASSESDFVFNYPISPGESIASGGGNNIRSLHRGLASTSPGTGDFWKFDAQDGNPGIFDDNDSSTFGAAAFNGTVAAIIKGSRVQLRNEKGFQNLVAEFQTPSAPRDIGFLAGALYAISSSAELYRLNPNGSMNYFQLPDGTPWRIRALDSTSMILALRGPLTDKGKLYILRLHA